MRSLGLYSYTVPSVCLCHVWCVKTISPSSIRSFVFLSKLEQGRKEKKTAIRDFVLLHFFRFCSLYTFHHCPVDDDEKEASDLHRELCFFFSRPATLPACLYAVLLHLNIVLKMRLGA